MLTKELIDQIAGATGLSKTEVDHLLKTTNAVVRENLMAGKAIQWTGIGVLEVKERNGRAYVHPRTGEPINTPSKNQLVFRPSAQLKDELKKL